MTNKIVTALDDGLKDVVKAGEDGGEAIAKHVEETGTKLGAGAVAHVENNTKITEDLTKAGEKPPETLPEAKPTEEPKKPEDSTPDTSAEDKAKAEAEETAKAAAIKAKVDELRTEGHAPQRHLDASDAQLEGRLGQPVMQGNPPRVAMNGGYVTSTKKMDPARSDALSLPETDPNKYMDQYKTNAAGDPMRHKCGNFATAFGDEESLVKAEAATRASIPSTASGHYVSDSVDVRTAIGDDGMANLRGRYIDPANPMTGTTINYKDVNFDGSKLIGVYDQDASGKWNLTTLYPEPNAGVNP